MSEAAILDVVKKNFQDHLILGEEGGIIGDSSSDYLWCIDPLDGTTNFAHCYPSFAVSIGVLYKGKPAAASVVEFVGGPKCWNTRTFTAAAGKGAFCNGEKIHVSNTDKVERSLLVTGFGYEHDDPWATNMELFKQFTDVSRLKINFEQRAEMRQEIQAQMQAQVEAQVQSQVQVQLQAHLEEQKKVFEQMLAQFKSGSGHSPPS